MLSTPASAPSACRRALVALATVALVASALLVASPSPIWSYLTWLADTYKSTFTPMPPSPYSHFRAVASHRLLFCVIDKNANSAFSDVLCSLARADDDESSGWWWRWLVTHRRTWADFELGCSWSSTYFAYQGLSERRLRAAFAHDAAESGWRSFVFVRDPLERFLSGYLSKCTPGHDLDHEICEAVFGGFNVSFEEAVAVVNATGAAADFAPGLAGNHFRRQSSFCDGAVGRGEFDTTYVLSRATSRRDVADMLTRVGVPRPLGGAVPAFDYHFPPTAAREQQQGGSFAHSTRAGGRVRRYFTDPALVRVLLRHYALDYRQLPLPVPEWAVELVGEDFVRGEVLGRAR